MAGLELTSAISSSAELVSKLTESKCRSPIACSDEVIDKLNRRAEALVQRGLEPLHQASG